MTPTYAPCSDPRCRHEHEQLVYAPRSNAGAEAERMLGRQDRVPYDYGDAIRRDVYKLPKGGGARKAGYR